VKRRKTAVAEDLYGSPHVVGPKELEKVCKGGPELVIVGTGHDGKLALTEDARRFLAQRSIKLEAVPTPQAVDLYNQATGRKAALLHVI
jgi:hypothetical protein